MPDAIIRAATSVNVNVINDRIRQNNLSNSCLFEQIFIYLVRFLICGEPVSFLKLYFKSN